MGRGWFAGCSFYYDYLVRKGLTYLMVHNGKVLEKIYLVDSKRQ